MHHLWNLVVHVFFELFLRFQLKSDQVSMIFFVLNFTDHCLGPKAMRMYFLPGTVRGVEISTKIYHLG